MGQFSNAKFDFETLPNGVIHIYDRGIDEISVTNDMENVLGQVNFQKNLSGRLVQYTDSEGRVDRIIHENAKFQGFAPGPWNAANSPEN